MSMLWVVPRYIIQGSIKGITCFAAQIDEAQTTKWHGHKNKIKDRKKVRIKEDYFENKLNTP